MTKHIMKFAATCLCALPLCVNAGDLTVSNVTLYGKLEFANETAYPASGGTITTNGNYVIHTFTTVGTNSFIVSSGSLTCDVLVVAGGGGGGAGAGGGGGAGGLMTNTTVCSSGYYAVVVGAGGSGAWEVNATAGENSSFGTNVAFGGGRGGSWGMAGGDGGSGGGGSCDYTTPYNGGAATNGQGYEGGWGYSLPRVGGGGGGASEAGVYGVEGGNGGDGVQNEFSGAATWYAGGGGGGVDSSSPGQGGQGGGGDGHSYLDAEDGTANTGGGGGGGPYDGGDGGDGGSGIVIVRYLNTSTNVTPSIHGINQNSASATNIFLGKVGIGTNSPAEKLHIGGNVRVDGMVVLTTPPGDLPMGVFTNQ